MKVELIRHGNTIWEGTGRYQGLTDVPLSEAGKNGLHQANTTPAVVYISPLCRTRQTAERIFPAARLAVVENFKEMNFGAFEGHSAREMEDDPAYRAWVEGSCRGRCPGGEDLAAFTRRTCDAFRPLMDEAAATGENLTIVAHGGTLMALMATFVRPQQDYFHWFSSCAQGYVLDGSLWRERGILTLLDRRDYYGEG